MRRRVKAMATEALGAVRYAPRRLLTALVTVLLLGCGYLADEVYHFRSDRIGRIEAEQSEVNGRINTLSRDVSRLEAEVSGIDGRQERIENKMDRLLDKVDALLRRR